MLVKKIIFSFLGIVCFIALSMGSTGYCSTPIAKFPMIAFDRVAIGGIQPFASKDYVRSIYGEPDEIIDRKGSRAYNDSQPDIVWKYGDTFSISFYKDTVFSAISSGSNGLKTPDGIAVGDSEAKLISIYGNKGKFGYWYRSDYETNLTFQVKDGKVTRIFVGWNL